MEVRLRRLRFVMKMVRRFELVDGDKIKNVRNDRSLCGEVVTVAEQPQSEHYSIHDKT